MNNALLQYVIQLEWEMFSQVSAVEGKALCQLDPETFAIMRSSQMATWPRALLESWLADLEAARQNGRNLMSEKYAWMMQSTFPAEFKQLVDRLPTIEEEALVLIDDIVAANVTWKQEIAKEYPLLSERGRPICTKDDSPQETSFESYLRGELKICSSTTLRLLHRHMRHLQRGRLNAAAAALLQQIQHYGYPSLAAAEQALASSAAQTA